MADLIDRAALLKAIQKEAVNAMELNANRYCESALAFGHCYSMVKKAPTVDAVEVKRGHWIKLSVSCGLNILECSECGTSHPNLGDAYCRDCGADMRERKET